MSNDRETNNTFLQNGHSVIPITPLRISYINRASGVSWQKESFLERFRKLVQTSFINHDNFFWVQ